MNKILFVAVISLLAIIAYNQIPERDYSTPIGQSGMIIAVDPTDGSLRAPSQQQRSALKEKQQTLLMEAEELKYRDTLTIHPDGTKSGVVNPQFLHSIYATKTADGQIVLHETKEPLAAQRPLEVE